MFESTNHWGPRPKMCVVGAGAVGGFLAALLAQAENDVSVVARGAHLVAMQQRGLSLTSSAGLDSFTVRVRAVDDPVELSKQDVVFVALKAHDLPGIASRLSFLLTEETIVVPVLNGIPWWYFYGLPNSEKQAPITCLDPAGDAARYIGNRSLIGCVVRMAATVPEPGVIHHTFGKNFILGEPTGDLSQRLTQLCRAMREASLEATASAHIRDSIWTKLVGNVSTNPLSALTHGSLADLCASPGLVALMRELSRECMEVGSSYGIRFAMDIEQIIENFGSLGPTKPSMLQDLEKGRQLEVPAILQSVLELARRVSVKTPVLDMIFALLSERAKHLG